MSTAAKSAGPPIRHEPDRLSAFRSATSAVPSKPGTSAGPARSSTLSVEPELKAGDLIGFSGFGFESCFINLMSYGIPWWSLSHIGILAEHHGELLLFESTTLSDLPCEIQGKCVKGSQAHRLADRLDTYHGHVWHYPLYRPLYDDENERLSDFLASTIGLPYDMAGAFNAGFVGFSWLQSRLHEENLHSLFCSEWCAAAHRIVGMFRTDAANRWSPNNLIRHERRRDIVLRPRLLK
jgi:hypothetical protein